MLIRSRINIQLWNGTLWRREMPRRVENKQTTTNSRLVRVVLVVYTSKRLDFSNGGLYRNSGDMLCFAKISKFAGACFCHLPFKRKPANHDKFCFSFLHRHFLECSFWNGDFGIRVYLFCASHRSL